MGAFKFWIQSKESQIKKLWRRIVRKRNKSRRPIQKERNGGNRKTMRTEKAPQTTVAANRQGNERKTKENHPESSQKEDQIKGK